MYALIGWGGVTPGQRPRTALAYVWQAESGWKADLVNPDGSSRYKRPKSIDEAEILIRFSGKDVPSQKLVKEAKGSLPVIHENDSRFDIQDSI